MKKLLWTIGLACAVALSSYAQGYVIFSSNVQNISTNDVSGFSGGGRTQGAGNYYYALFWSSTISSGAPIVGVTDGVSGYAFNTAGWNYDSDPTAAAASTATPGRFAAIAPNSDGSTTISGITGGNSCYFVIVGWSASMGTTLAQMEANLASGYFYGYLGQSAVSGLIQTGNGGLITPGGIMGGVSPLIQAFTLGATTVPEPGTLALAAFGVASLFMLNRKK